jgi:zinc transport system ATP-binding protein
VSEPSFDVAGLAVRFGDHRVLEAVTFEVPPGAFVAVVGPNGSGKSTLLKVCLGLVPPEAGRVRLHGQEPGRVPPEWIGYVPQVKTFDRTFPALAVELVITGLRRRWPGRLDGGRERALAALERVGVADLAFRPSGRLSGGELQRVYLARAVVRQPRLVFLDEPATGIDVVGEADMYRLLDDYRRDTGATVMMVTHDLEAASHHATDVLLLNRRQIGFGTPEAVLNEDCLRRAFGHLGHEHAMHLHD